MAITWPLSSSYIFFKYSLTSDYAYIADEATGDPTTGSTAQNCNRHSLSTFVNVSNVPNAPFSMIVTSNTLQPLSNNGGLEPEPYATTDILRAEKEKVQQHHYAVNASYYLCFFITLATPKGLMGICPLCLSHIFAPS